MAVGASARSGARCWRRGHAFGAACMMHDRPPAISSREKTFESKRPFKLNVMMQRKYPREDSLYIANAVRFGPLTNRSPRLVYPRTGQKVWPAFICVPKRTIWAVQLWSCRLRILNLQKRRPSNGPWCPALSQVALRGEGLQRRENNSQDHAPRERISTIGWSPCARRCRRPAPAARPTPTANKASKVRQNNAGASATQRTTWPTDLGFALVFAHAGMWRCAVSSANFRPQCGHSTRSSGASKVGGGGRERTSTPALMACWYSLPAFRAA